MGESESRNPAGIADRGTPSRTERSDSSTSTRPIAAAVILCLVALSLLSFHGNAGASTRAPNDTVIASDALNRTVTSGWGQADIGGAYTYADPSAFSVNGSQGLIKLPAAGQSRTARLAATSTAQTATVSLGAAALPTSGNGISMALLARERDGKAYRATVRVQPGGKASLGIVRLDGSPSALTTVAGEQVLPYTLAAGSMLTLELTTSGTTDVDLSARAWPKGTNPPAVQISGRDSSAGRLSAAGTTGIWTYTSSSSQAATVLVDDLLVTTPASGSSTPPTAPATTPSSATPTATSTVSTSSPAPSATATAGPASTPPSAPGAPAGAPSQPGQEYGGAPALGSKSYPAPAGARFVSPTGSDNAAGTQSAPFRTIAKAISAASSGQTIVLRTGLYHESIVIPSGKTLTIQPFQNEIAWLDGSSVVSSWAADGGRWRSDNWTAHFDASPTYTRGAADNTENGWGFVNPDHPMAAHPDQVWFDDQPQTQVGALDQLTANTFYVDEDANALYLGSNPQGHTVRASDLSKAISVRADGSTLRGFGVSRFAPSVPDMGAVTIEKPQCLVENMVFTDSATTGLSLVTTDITVTNVTSTRSGMLGVHANYADRLNMTNLSATFNNLEQFNTAPVSGGFKITKSRDVTIADSRFSDNKGPGLWLDESVYDARVLRNKMISNVGHGVSAELSGKVTLVGNLLMNNGGFGMKINDTSEVRIWNNTLVDNGRPINIVQDARRGSDKSTPGHDPRQPFPDPTLPWLNGPVQVRNNVISGTTGNCLLCVEDYSKERTAEQMQVTANGDVYRRVSTSSPQWVVVWSKGASSPAVFTSLDAFKQATGQESASLALNGSAATDQNGAATGTVTGAAGTVAQPLPGDIAALWGKPAGSKQLGSSLTR